MVDLPGLPTEVVSPASVSSILPEGFGCVHDPRPRLLSGFLEMIVDALVPLHVSVFPTFRPLSKAGLEFLEDEVTEVMRGVDVDGSDSIEWQVMDTCRERERRRGLGT